MRRMGRDLGAVRIVGRLGVLQSRSKLTLSRVPVARANRAKVWVDGRPLPLSNLAIAD